MKGAVGALAVAALLATSVLPAAADGSKVIVGGGAFHHRRAVHPHTNVIFVVPSTPRWVPGYWTYRWVPQAFTQYVWVPGHYDPSGYWVEGQYVPQTVETGYYQSVWMSGYWLDP